jgi:hypothetical protein
MMRKSDIPFKVDSVEAAYEIFEKHKDEVFRNTQSQLVADVEAGNRIVLVYQMGKVGSTSYTQSLEDIDDLTVRHIHRLNAKNNELMISRFLRNGMVRLALKERRWQAVSDFIRNHTHQIYILSAMRNPIDRNISAFFQNLKLQENDNVERLIKKFLESYPHQVPIDWFNEQFRDALGIDIYDYPFNKERGWDTFSCKNYNCLLMTAEAADLKKTEAINSFLGTELGVLKRKNIGASKEYSGIYGKFKGEIVLPESYIESQLNTKVVAHFYTAKKIEEFRLPWSSTV